MISNDKFKKIKDDLDSLSVEEKVSLISDLLQSSGLQVVMGGGNFISADVVLQIQGGSSESLVYIFEALARRVASESSSNNTSSEHLNLDE